MDNSGLPLDFSSFDQGVRVPDYALWIEGAPVPAQLLRSIMSVSISQEANQPASFTCRVYDPGFVLVDAGTGLFAEGRRVEIALGYVGKALQTMISGEISAVAAELEPGGGLTLQVEGFDHLHAAARGTAYRQFAESKSDDAIVSEIARDLRLDAEVEATATRTGERVQQHVSSLAFLQAIAADNDYQLWMEDRRLCFKRTRPGPRVALARGRDLISFTARLSTAGQVGAVEVRGWDAGQEQGFSYRAEASRSPGYAARLASTGLAQVSGQRDSPSERIIHAEGQVRSVEEARTLAEAVLAEQRRSLFIADGSAVGNPDLRVGSSVRLLNMWRFSDDYVVDSARHEIGPAGYRTTFRMRQHL